ncbi:MAG: type IV toxin-antitoxin system AbiEi family antitoxin domain-containing protein [Alphaproteobacteria bacterium]|nr:type IV toxin-antitoxin system AbiEi family antitoxin domain-containing protein [Alphaproteobacteria bacterium]
MQNERKLKTLFKLWPMHTALPVAWLKEKGFSQSLIQKYISSGWIQSLNRGVVVRPDDIIEWSGFLWGLQQLNPFHIGGKTALELQGKAHFVKFQESQIFLFTKPGTRLPQWATQNKGSIKFINVPTNLFTRNVGLKEHSFGEYSLRISNPARAFLEYMHLSDKYHSLDEAYYLMENLQFLSHDLMQEALEACRSVKVKRFVLCLAKKQNANWFKNLDRSKITLGKGVRKGVENGRYDSEFLITYPKSWARDKNESVF